MKRAFTDRFYRQLAGLGLGVVLVASGAGATPEQGVRPWGAQVEAKVSALEAALLQALQASPQGDLAANWPVGWPVGWKVNWRGPNRTVVELRRDSKSIPDSDFQKITDLLASPRISAPSPAPGGQFRAVVLGSRQGWLRPLILLEKSTPLADRSVIAVIDPFRQFAVADIPSRRRYWIFDPQGEVLYQSEGRFSGSSLGGFEHFANPASTRSFDQVEVKSSWSRSRQLGWLLLEEQLAPAPAAGVSKDRALGWLAGLAFRALEWSWLLALACVFGLAYWMRPARRRPESMEQDAPPAHEPERMAEVLVPRLVQSQPPKPTAIAPAPRGPAFDEKAWNQAIIRSRSLLELGRRLMTAVAEGARSPVLFLEYHRPSGHLIFRDQLGIPAHQAPVGLRIPADENGSPLGEQRQLQDLLLQRLGVSHFEALELRSAATPSSRQRLLAVFVVLQPGVSSHERRNEFERLLALSGRYYEAILRPLPPPPSHLEQPRF